MIEKRILNKIRGRTIDDVDVTRTGFFRVKATLTIKFTDGYLIEIPVRE